MIEFYNYILSFRVCVVALLTTVMTTMGICQNLPGPGNSLTFNGQNYISCGTSNRSISNQVTVEAWVKTTSYDYQWIAGKYLNSNSEEKGFHLYTSNGLAYLNGRIGMGAYLSSGASTTLVNDGRWHHIAGTTDGSSWRIYVDGILENTGVYNYSRADFTTTTSLSIGNYAVQSGQYFQGDIDEVRVWRTVRSVAEIQATMCRKFVTAPADLVAYYRFDQTTGLAAVDQGSQPTTGSLVGFASTPWHLSGAPLGDAATALYQASWPAGTQLSQASTTGDVAVVSSIGAAARGVQLYAVNSAPSIAAGAGASNAYFGVFTAGGSAAASYTLQLQPLGGATCRAAQQRVGNDAAWAALPTPTVTATALSYGARTYRGEYILLTGAAAAPLTITGDSAVCAGATGRLAAAAAGATSYLWSTGATTAAISGLAPGTYSVTATFAGGCSATSQATIRQARVYQPVIAGDSVLCPGASTVLRASTPGPATYLWSNGATAATITVSQTGTYTVTATSPAGCALQTSFRVRVAPSPSITITGNSQLCPGTTSTLAATTTNATSVRWNTGATTAIIAITAPGTYTATATSAAGCTQQAAFVVTTLPTAPVAITGDSAVCAGPTGRLSASAAGATGYQWSTGATTASISGLAPGTYTVTATFAGGCTAVAQATIRRARVYAPTISGDSVLCLGATARLVASAGGPVAYLWNTGATTASISVTQAGTYTVMATSAAGCPQQARIRVRAGLAAPAFTLGADTTLCEGSSLTLNGPNGPGLRYLWSDGSTGRQLTAATAGTYSLRVSSECGSTQVARIISPKSCLLVPNIITPNNDARNDVFVVQGLVGNDWSLDIYNRWGRPVLHTDSYRNDWGSDAAAGIYYVLLRRASTGYSYKGWVEVAR